MKEIIKNNGLFGTLKNEILATFEGVKLIQLHKIIKVILEYTGELPDSGPVSSSFPMQSLDSMKDIAPTFDINIMAIGYYQKLYNPD